MKITNHTKKKYLTLYEDNFGENLSIKGFLNHKKQFFQKLRSSIHKAYLKQQEQDILNIEDELFFIEREIENTKNFSGLPSIFDKLPLMLMSLFTIILSTLSIIISNTQKYSDALITALTSDIKAQSLVATSSELAPPVSLLEPISEVSQIIFTSSNNIVVQSMTIGLVIFGILCFLYVIMEAINNYNARIKLDYYQLSLTILKTFSHPTNSSVSLSASNNVKEE